MKVLVGAVVVLLLLSLLSAGGWAWRYYTAEVRGVVDAEEQIESAGSRVQFYNHFHDMCSSIKTSKQALATQYKMLGLSEGGKESVRVRANIAGLEATVASRVNQYNADSAKGYTAARFKDNSLPHRVSVDGTTHCN